MPPIEETGKRKAARIPLDYHKRRDLVARGKLALALAAAALAGCWAMLAAMRPADFYSPGPVTAAHATWDAECAACHVPFAPILTTAVHLTGTPATTVDEKCQVCHRGAAHHPTQKPDDRRACADCHTEHRGRDAQIARVNDRLCTHCHADLRAHTLRPATLTTSEPYAPGNIAAFNLRDHPQFRSAASDPGRLKFSHRRHLAPGLNLGPGDRFGPRRLQDLAVADRNRYRAAGAPDDRPIQLDCIACHRLDATGAYMQPIRFEEHCRCCHLLNYEPAPDPAFSSRSIAHGLPPKQIGEYLRAAYINAQLDADPKAFASASPQRPLPGKPIAAESPAINAALREQVARADTFLRGRCQECHDLAGTPTQAAIEPVRVPSIWFEHARFDHSAHRAVECRVCHQQSYLYEAWKAGADEPALDNRDVLLPRLEVCTHCHAPRNEHREGGARFDCVECHLYHAADQPSAAERSAARGAARRWPLDEFLRGPAPIKAP